MKKIYMLAFLVLIIFWGCKEDKNTDYMLSKDHHSYANFNDVRVNHLSLHLTVDFNQQILKGKVDLTLDHFTDATVLILDTRKLVINKVLADGKETSFSL